MSPAGDAELLVRARCVLLDALAALDAQRDALVLVGAQAIYLHTASVAFTVDETTTDSDLAIDTRALRSTPKLEEAMTKAGFHRDVTQPGSWLSDDGIPVDLMVPEALSGTGGRRGARIPPHSSKAARRTPGLEAAVVDNEPMPIHSYDPTDPRQAAVKVAGPAALLVAKLHKLGERASQPHRLVDKDAHDIYRLLVATETAALARRLNALMADEIAGATTGTAVDYLRELFSGPAALGPTMVGRAEELTGDPAVATASAAFLAQDLRAAIGR